MTDDEHPLESSAESNVLSWHDRYTRGQAWHRYWLHPKRWSRRRWFLFWLGIVSHFGIAGLLAWHANEATGWTVAVLWVTASFFGLVGLVRVGLARAMRTGLRRADLRRHDDG